MTDREKEIRERLGRVAHPPDSTARTLDNLRAHQELREAAPADLEWCLGQLEAVTRERDEVRDENLTLRCLVKPATHAAEIEGLQAHLEQAERERDKALELLTLSNLVLEGAHHKLSSREEEMDEIEAERDAALKRERRLRDHITDALDCLGPESVLSAANILRGALAGEGRE